MMSTNKGFKQLISVLYKEIIMSAKHFIGGQGFVERLDVFGDDLTVVNAARVSFAKESLEVTLADEKLIRYLARNNHITPFFHPQIRFRIRMPIFVAREWYRHTIGFSRNEVSRRYVNDRPDCWEPVQSLRLRDKSVKQGSQSVLHPDENSILSRWSELQKTVIGFYEEIMDAGVAPEVARGILPQSMYTEFIETGSLYAYARLCKLRLDPHAQKEIRDYADAICACLVNKFPVSWKYLMEGVGAAAPIAPVPAAAPAPVPVAPVVVETTDVSTAALPPLESGEYTLVFTPSEETKIGAISDLPKQMYEFVGHFGIGC